MPTRARTATALLTAAVLGLTATAATPALAAPAGSAATASPFGPAADGSPAEALEAALAGLPAPHTTAALVRYSGPDLTWHGGAGTADLRTGRGAMEHSRFRAGSVTKTFTAAVVLQLAAEGRTDLDAPARRHLPGLLPREFAGVTVRQLLDHTSGIRPADSPDSFAEAHARRFDTVDPREQVANAVAKGPEFAPGERQHYLNINYTVLGLLVEELTGTSYEQAVTDRILRPLGLRHTSFPGNDPRIHGPHHRGYQRVTGADGTTRLVDVTEWNLSAGRAAGDIISTTADLERFLRALFRGKVVRGPLLEEMFTVPRVTDVETGDEAQLSAGLARMELPDGTAVWGKTGGRYGYNTGIGATRDLERVLVYSVNSTDAKAEGTNPVIGRLLAVFGL
ncbi:serine hydrolase domain-containing protein [Streptomyces chilikensis]|uniref:Serine hydrolase domain-containing protein n=1 Tax=Streptomyces chilikensis TaxID=1194079 RepID=A0ABV3ELL7_9ACTN